MEPLQIPPIHILSDTGYNLAPGKVPPELIGKPDPPIPGGQVSAGIRVEAAGKTYFTAAAPERHKLLVEWALAWSVRIWSYVDESKFREYAGAANFGEAEIDAILASVQIHDDAYFRRPAHLEHHPQNVIDAHAEAKAKAKQP